MAAGAAVQWRRQQWDAFLQRLEQLKTLTLEVGILEGKTRYPPGHVGSKSRLHDNPERFAELRGQVARFGVGWKTRNRQIRKMLDRQEARHGKRSRNRSERALRKAMRAEGLRTKGLRKSSRGTPVARVAGVLMVMPHWREHLDMSGGRLSRELRELMQVLKAGDDPRAYLHRIGTRLKREFQREVRSMGHVDTGLLLRTVDYRIFDEKAAAIMDRYKKRQKKARRAARRRIRRRRRR